MISLKKKIIGFFLLILFILFHLYSKVVIFDHFATFKTLKKNLKFHSWEEYKRYTKCLEIISHPSLNNPNKLIVKDPEVIIIVDSKVDDYKSRCAIRAVWSHYSPKQLSNIMSYVVFFQVGFKNNETLNHVRHENRLYQDLLIYNHIPEMYKKVGEKLMASFEHINKSHWSRLKYVVKTDDDVYVSIKKYLIHLKSILNSNIDYEGLLFVNSPFILNVRSKNYQPPIRSLKNIFPPFCSGRGYFVRSTKINCLVSSSKAHNNLINSDTNVGYLLKFCNTSMKRNEDYSHLSIFNSNLATAIDHIKMGTPFYFMHGLRNFDQLLFDEIFSSQDANKT